MKKLLFTLISLLLTLTIINIPSNKIKAATTYYTWDAKYENRRGTPVKEYNIPDSIWDTETYPYQVVFWNDIFGPYILVSKTPIYYNTTTRELESTVKDGSTIRANCDSRNTWLIHGFENSYPVTEIIESKHPILDDAGQYYYNLQNIQIISPRDNYTDVIKTMVYKIYYTTLTDNPNDYIVKIYDGLGKSISENPDVINYKVERHTFAVSRNMGMYESYLDVAITYKTSGTKTLKAILNNNTKLINSNIKTVIIKDFVDNNGDGKDDETGQTPYEPPQLPNDQEQAIGSLKEAYNTIQSGIATISVMVGTVYAWLPTELKALIYLILSVIGLALIVKIIRG